MALVLAATSRPQLFADVLRPPARGTFVPTLDALSVGARVPLVLQLAEEKLVLTVECTVLEVAQKGPADRPGVFVVLAADEQERCRAFLGTGPAAELPARTELRVDCELPLKLLSPAVPRDFETRNISSRGVLASCDVALAVGQKLRIAVELAPGNRIQTDAEVAWVRAELKLVGLQFTGLEAADEKRLDAAIVALKAKGGARAGPAAPETAAAAGRPDVIVADDEPGVLLFVTRALTKTGLKVVTFARGDDALKAIRAQKPRVVLLDVLMPGLDGLQVCSTLRADAMLKQVPVVLLSGLEREKVEKMANDVGANAWLQKPLALTDLRALIDRLLGRDGQGPA